MKTPLFTQEQIIRAVDLPTDQYFLTNKRLVYESKINANLDNYIALNQLSNASTQTTQVKINKFSDQQIRLYTFLTVILGVVGFLVYMNSQTHSSFQEYGIVALILTGSLIMAVFGTAALFVLTIVFASINAASSKTVDKVRFRMLRLDGTEYGNMLYETETLNDLKKLEMDLNEAIFNKVS